jgi:hypothetical protein
VLQDPTQVPADVKDKFSGQEEQKEVDVEQVKQEAEQIWQT